MLPLLRSTCLRRPEFLTPAAFRKDESGAITVMGLFLFAIMIVAGGVAMDLMRSEADRAARQYAYDRASLAAAPLNEEREAKEVVESYLRAAGYEPKDVRIQTHKTEQETLVTIRGDSSVESLFMNVLGEDTVEAPVWSSARETRRRLELSLVLDISGSMGGSKLTKMKAAAKEFVDELITGREDMTSVSLIAYNDRVNVGSDFAQYLPMSTEHDKSNCVVFEADDFYSTSLTAGTVLRRMAHYDHQSGKDTNAPEKLDDPFCPTDDYAAILPWSNDVTALQDAIDALGAWNWTAMDLGVKWGAMLLDPSMRSIQAAMITDDKVSDDFVGRPYNYDEPEATKVIVVMTDGKNTDQFDLKDYAKNGPSGVFVWNDQDISPPTAPAVLTPVPVGDGTGATTTISPESFYSSSWVSKRDNTDIDDRSGWWASPDRGDWLAWDRDNDGSGLAWYTETRFSFWAKDKGQFWLPHQREYADEPAGGTAAVELSWQELFGALGVKYLESRIFEKEDNVKDDEGNITFYGRNMQWSSRKIYIQADMKRFRASAADTNLSRICDAARLEDVQIFTIAFQAPDEGEAAMKDCAGEGFEGRYHPVEDLNIDQAFDDILAAIEQLRLTR